MSTPLRRELGLAGATLMGLGAMVGTGVFVSIGIGAGIVGPAVVLAITIAALLAMGNALSSAQLAASMPVSGGTYEYGHVYLNHWLGFSAGWVFLCAKSASAATAALGFSSYFLGALGVTGYVVPVALATAVMMTALVAAGIRRSNQANVIIVTVTMSALAAFVVAGTTRSGSSGVQWLPFVQPAEGRSETVAVLQATALMFVAFTGYARIATLGEEVKDPRRTIPRAVIATVAVAAIVYIAVGAVGTATVGPAFLAAAVDALEAPLEAAADTFGVPGLGWVVAVGAMTAMLGVLLNLILGLSRVVLAMARRNDMPPALAAVSADGSPVSAVLVSGAVIAALTLLGDIRLAWSFSAFTVLVYYAITNLAALRLPREKRLYHPAIAWAGLVCCLGLTFFIDLPVMLAGLAMIATGLAWHAAARWLVNQRV